MSGVNRVTILGNLGKDVELKYSANGKALATFSVAVNEGYGEKEHVEWFSVAAWEKLAENCSKCLSKGQQVFVEGRLQTRSWDDNGTKKYRTELIASNVQFLGKRDDNQDETDPDDLPLD